MFGQYTTLIADGSLGILYIDTKRNDIREEFLQQRDLKIHINNEHKGSGGAEALEYFRFMIGAGQFVGGDHILLDSETSWFINDIRELVRGSNISLHPFYPGTGQLSDPCDCNQHSGDQRRISDSVVGRHSSEPPTSDEHIKIIKDAYYDTTSSEITNHFKHCGFLGNEDPNLVASRLFHDWNRSSFEKFEKYHQASLEQYLWYRKLSEKTIKDRPELIGPWWDTIRKFL